MGKHDNNYDHNVSKKIADNLEQYLNSVNTYIIIEGKSVKKIDKANEVVKQAIKDLRKGREDKVFDEAGYNKYIGSITD